MRPSKSIFSKMTVYIFFKTSHTRSTHPQDYRWLKMIKIVRAVFGGATVRLLTMERLLGGQLWSRKPAVRTKAELLTARLTARCFLFFKRRTSVARVRDHHLAENNKIVLPDLREPPKEKAVGHTSRSQKDNFTLL